MHPNIPMQHIKQYSFRLFHCKGPNHFYQKVIKQKVLLLFGSFNNPSNFLYSQVWDRCSWGVATVCTRDAAHSRVCVCALTHEKSRATLNATCVASGESKPPGLWHCVSLLSPGLHTHTVF